MLVHIDGLGLLLLLPHLLASRLGASVRLVKNIGGLLLLLLSSRVALLLLVTTEVGIIIVIIASAVRVGHTITCGKEARGCLGRLLTNKVVAVTAIVIMRVRSVHVYMLGCVSIGIIHKVI